MDRHLAFGHDRYQRSNRKTVSATNPLAKAGIVVPTFLFGIFIGFGALSTAYGQGGVTFEVTTSVKNDDSPPLATMAAGLAPLVRREIDSPRLHPNRARLMAAQAPLIDTAIQTTFGPVGFVKIVAATDALGKGFPGTQGQAMTVSSVPPDTNGAVGDTQYVQTVNTFFAIFNKADILSGGTNPAAPVKPIYGWAPITTIWHGFGTKCE
jgi:hypothetical protein